MYPTLGTHDPMNNSRPQLLHLPQHFSHTAATARRRRTSHARVSPRSLPILCELLWCDSLRRTVTIIGSPGLPLPFAPHLSAITLPTRRPRPRRRSRTHHAPPPPAARIAPLTPLNTAAASVGGAGGILADGPGADPSSRARVPGPLHPLHRAGRRPPRGARGGVGGGGYGNVAPSPGGGASEPSTRPPSS